jgi:hypothetical protein
MSCDNEAQLIYLTLDGDLVRGTFNPMINGFGFYRGLALDPHGQPMAAVNGRLSIYRTSTSEAYMQLDLSDRRKPFLLTYLPETIVSRGDQIQKEWLPRITDLLSEIPGSHLMWSYRTDKRTFLSQADKIFTNLFTYGLISLRNRNIVQVTPGTGLQEELLSAPSPIPALVPIEEEKNDLNQFENYLRMGSRAGIPAIPNIGLAPGSRPIPSLLPPRPEKSKLEALPSGPIMPPVMPPVVAPAAASVVAPMKLPPVISPKQLAIGKVPSVPSVPAIPSGTMIPPIGKIPVVPKIPGRIDIPRIP